MTDTEATDWIDSRTERWEPESGADWAVTDGPQILGRVGLRRIDLQEGLGEVVYWSFQKRVGAGWRPELMHSVQNLASCRVAHIACYEFEGSSVKRRAIPTAGTTYICTPDCRVIDRKSAGWRRRSPWLSGLSPIQKCGRGCCFRCNGAAPAPSDALLPRSKGQV
jgi:hypothetical protein